MYVAKIHIALIYCSKLILFFLVKTNTSLSIDNINFHILMQNDFCILPIFATIPQLFMRKNDESPRSASNRNEYTPMGTC